MTWLIVGGNGQLGTALSVILDERGMQYKALGSQDLDIRSASETLDLIYALKPSVVINAAAWTDVDGAESNVEPAYAVNVEGALNLTLAVKAIDAVFVHISTDYVFSGTGSKPWSTEDLCAPDSVYGKSKAAGESAVLLNYSDKSYVFRTAWLYSQWGKNFAKTMTRIAVQDRNGSENLELVKVVDDQVGQPTFAIDLANQIVDAVNASLPFGIYHATNSGQATWFEFAREIFKLSGSDDSRVTPVPTSEFPKLAKRPSFSVLSHESWSKETVPPMRDWRLALSEAMPAILSVVKTEE